MRETARNENMKTRREPDLSVKQNQTFSQWGISSIGRVCALQARGTGIETPMLQMIFVWY